jgi:hypothetical protein
MSEFEGFDERDLADEDLAEEMAQEFSDTEEAEEIPPSPEELTEKERIAASWKERNAAQMEEILEYPAVKSMIDYEAQREADLKPIREAFVKAQEKKQK